MNSEFLVISDLVHNSLSCFYLLVLQLVLFPLPLDPPHGGLHVAEVALDYAIKFAFGKCLAQSFLRIIMTKEQTKQNVKGKSYTKSPTSSHCVERCIFSQSKGTNVHTLVHVMTTYTIHNAHIYIQVKDVQIHKPTLKLSDTRTRSIRMYNNIHDTVLPKHA